MGHSFTVHVVGVPRGLAMSKMEMAQEAHKAEKDGMPITYWFAQTQTGVKMLGTYGIDELGSAAKIRLPKMVTCPICHGDGHNGKYHCPVCNGSGITRPGYEKGWQPWQLEHMKQDREEA